MKFMVIMRVRSVELYAIYDSLGEPTVEAVVNGHVAASPGGTSKSKYEAPTVPIRAALRSFGGLKRRLLGNYTQSSFDEILSKSLSQLGSQATTALSLAFFSASSQKVTNTFPILLANVLGGGSHSPKGSPSIQEILVAPVKAKTLPEMLKTVFAVWKDVGENILKKSFAALNYESSWTAAISNEGALDTVSSVASSYRCEIGIDAASSQYYKNGVYLLGDKFRLSQENMIEYVLGLVRDYNLFYIEDPLHQDDFDGFAELCKKLRGRSLVCGDDLISTNFSRFMLALTKCSINSTIVKPNQNGTVSGCLDIIRNSYPYNTIPIVSHRSRETPDTSLCRLAQLAPLAKLGVAGIRTVKLNGLLRLWNTANKPRISKFVIP
jgi:enolase